MPEVRISRRCIASGTIISVAPSGAHNSSINIVTTLQEYQLSTINTIAIAVAALFVSILFQIENDLVLRNDNTVKGIRVFNEITETS